MDPAIPTIETRADAEAFLDERIGQGVKPGLERIAGLVGFMGDPHLDYPVIQVAGTNGKTTVTRLIADILGAHGIRTGTFTSPHLHRLEERISIDGAPISPDEFTQAVSDIAWFVEEYERRTGSGVTYFEVTAALAFSVFAGVALDVAVVEVGLGGRWDATSVVDADVAVITGIALDHVEFLGETIGEIAGEKAAIIDDRATVVTGPLPAAAEGAITARVEEADAKWYRSGDGFAVAEATIAVGGWVADVDGIYRTYEDLYLPIHGRHQVDNLATAIAAAEVLLGRALDPDALRTALGATSQPGRIEVVHHRPLVVVDGAHNAQGIEGLAATLEEEFPDARWQVVVGMRGRRSPGKILEPLGSLSAHLWATAPDDPGAVDAQEIASSAARLLGCPSTVVDGVPEAVAAAMEAAGGDGSVIVTGSLYVAGEARAALIGTESRPSGVHVRFEAERADESELDDDWADSGDIWTEGGGGG